MIEIIDLEKKIKGKVIFEKLNFNIRPGEITYLTGSNGSGKTVFIKILSNLMNKSAGNIKYQNYNNVELFVKENLRVSFNDNYFLNNCTGRKNLEKLFKINNVSCENIDYWFDRLMLEDELVKNYSSGMLKKLSIIQAIYEKKNFIILDEPFSNLDKQSVLEVVEIIKELKSLNLAILITTHKDDLVLDLEDCRVSIE